MKYVPRNYMKRAIRFALKHVACGLFMKPGLGKTGIMLKVYETLKKRKQTKGVIVVVTKKILQFNVWQKEIFKWGYDFKVSIVHGDNKLEALKVDADIYLTTWDNAQWLEKNLRNIKADIIILDESSKLKNWSAKRTRAFCRIAKKAKFKRRYLLTGTPAAKGYIDLFPQAFFMDFGETLGKYITKFRNEHFDPAGFKGYGYVLIEGHDKIIDKAIKPMVISIGDEELDLPPLNQTIRFFSMSKSCREKYKELKDELITWIDGGVVTTANSGAATTKLRQLASGAIYVTDLDSKGIPKTNHKGKVKIKVQHFHSDRVDILKELVEELRGQKVLIGYNYKHERARFEKAFSKYAYTYSFADGDTTDKQAKLITEKWDKGFLDILFGQMSSVAYGLNLQESGCTNLIIFSPDWNLETIEQFIKRVYRQGVYGKVNLIWILCEGTIDEYVFNNLTAKDYTQTTMLNNLKDYLKEVKMTAKTDSELLQVFIKSTVAYNDKPPVYEEGATYADTNFCYLVVQKIGTWTSKQKLQFLKDCGCRLRKKDSGYDIDKKVKIMVFAGLGIVEGGSGTFTIKRSSAIKEYLKLASKSKVAFSLNEPKSKKKVSKKKVSKKKVSKKKVSKKKVSKKKIVKKKVSKKKAWGAA